MNHENEQKRLFFAFEVNAPWPRHLPEGRMLEEAHRHLTIAFLGSTHYPSLERILPMFPRPNLKVGMVGKFNECLFLPPRRPNVVTWHVDWIDKEHDLGAYQRQLVEWLQSNDFPITLRKNGFLPHVTICRHPFQFNEWKNTFVTLPMMITAIHLYESLGHLQYRPCWTFPLKSPFEKIDHAETTTYRIRGENISQVHHHALIALAFLHPPLLSYVHEIKTVSSLNEIISDLNALINKGNAEGNIPFHSVSFQGELQEDEDQTLMGEMTLKF